MISHPLEGKTVHEVSGRRNFLKQALGLMGWGSLTVWAGGALAVVGRFFFPRFRYEPPTRFKVGRLVDYREGSVDARWLSEHRIFIIRGPQGMYALQAICTHLGCIISWFDSEKRFKCPCHGSFFNLEGDVIGGPAPEPLYRPTISQDKDGSIVVDVAVNANRPDQREKTNFLLKV